MNAAPPPGPRALAKILGAPPPTPEQARIIAHPLTPLLVVAGAGSGKTATMSQRVVHLVVRGEVRPDQVLGLTFTRRATAELDQRVAARLARLAGSGLVRLDEEAGATIATYNAFAGSLVREHGLRIGVDPDSTLITGARAWQIAMRLIEERTAPLPVDRPGAAASILLALEGALSENLLTVDEAAGRIDELVALMEDIGSVRGCKTLVRGAPEALTARLGMLEAVAAYRDYKRRHALLDFGDQIALGCRIAEEAPEVARQLRERHRAVLLDEFQDTSVAQIRLLSALFAGSGVTAVGDPNQAIYGWRGASAGALDAFHERFNPDGAAGSPVLPLSVAWRNDRAILRAANVTSSPLRHRDARPADSGAAHIPVEELRPRPGADGAREGRVVGAFVQDPLQEARTIAAFMEDRWGPDAEMAVLCRTRAQIAPIAEALEERGVPYEVIGLGGMLDVPEVADVRAALTVAADPERGDRLMRLLTGQGLGATDLAALAALARDQVRAQRRRDAEAAEAAEAADTAGADAAGADGDAERETPLLSEAIEALARQGDSGGRVPGAPGLSGAGARAAVRLARALRRVRAGLALPLPDLVVLTEQALGLDIEVAARVGNPLGRRALDRFRQVAEQFAAQVDRPDPAGFLAWLDAAEERENGMEAPRVEPEPGAVQLLTIHAAKGLEWDAVAVAGLVEQVFPSYRARAREDLAVADRGWMTDAQELPHPLRADARILPPFAPLARAAAGLEAAAIKDAWEDYTLALGRFALAEERRLAYVALTRARHDLLLTGSHLAGRATSPRPMSRFLAELVRRDLVDPYGPGWQDYDEDRPNSLAASGATGVWPPPEPDGVRGIRARARRRAAARVAAARAAGAGLGGGLAGADPIADQWEADARLLLAERSRRREQAPSVRLPDHLPATRVDDLRADRGAFALDLRRPLPPEPSPAGRLGTVFHDAVALRLAARGQLLTLAEAGVPDTLDPAGRRTLERWLKTACELPLLQDYVLEDTETELELALGATTLRCRLDAVFRGPDGTWLVVDWKTGWQRAPVDQLSVYVHALAAHRGVGAESVRAAYVYVNRPGGLVDELGAADLLPLDEIEASLRVEED